MSLNIAFIVLVIASIFSINTVHINLHKKCKLVYINLHKKFFFYFCCNCFFRLIIYSLVPNFCQICDWLSLHYLLWKEREEKKRTLKLVKLVNVEHLKEKRLNGEESRNRTKNLHLAHDFNFLYYLHKPEHFSLCLARIWF